MIHDRRIRALILQALVLLGFVVAVLWIGSNTIDNLQRQNIAAGFGFWDEVAGFGVNQALIDYDQQSSYGRVFWVGLLNTLLVAAIGIVLATVIGFAVGIARLSNNWLVAKLAAAYVEVIRNVPLLLQIFFWYFGVLKQLPHPRDSLVWLDSVFINIRGIYGPSLQFADGGVTLAVCAGIAFGAAVLVHRWARKRQMQTGQFFPSIWIGGGLVVLGIVIGLIASGSGLSVEMPKASRFNVAGGVRIIPEFVALVLALSIYTASFIAEIVRAGILAVPKGQTEASKALGLSGGQTMRLVIIPQAMRVIIPPLTSQFLNLTKNSSLAVAIAYPDLVSVFAGTTLNQTGQALEVIGVTMLVYLILSLSTSAFMNWFNDRMALKGRT